ncbi:oxygen-sensing cyclic-di-GMP phosphodiesterase DosP [Desulfobacter sp.]|uniref:oxygen-sensing cyclic-di-GMP phosphodiesterase DosP n=1 Tax=Desulfobacter sp. TaxID=2294 RepID=UPI003D0E5A4C
MDIGNKNVTAEKFLISLLDKLPIAVILLDEFDTIHFFNHIAECMWGMERSEVEGQNVSQALSQELSFHGDYIQSNGIRESQTLIITSDEGIQTNVIYIRMPIDFGNGQQQHIILMQSYTAEDNDKVKHFNSLLTAINYINRPMLVLDAQRHIVHVNYAFTEMFGYSLSEMIGRDPAMVLPCPFITAKELARYKALPWGQRSFNAEMRLRSKDGQELWTRIYSSLLGEKSEAIVGYSVDILQDLSEDRKIRNMERDVLQALTSSLSFTELGNYICRRIEAIAPGVLVSVCCITDNRMLPWSAPSFPEEYGIFFQNMEIGEGVASCGTAAYRGEAVMVRDITTDPLWAPYKHVMLPHGFRACWTYPVKRNDDSVAATFAFYFKQGGEPDQYLEHVAEAGVHLCVLAIEREENRQALNQLVQFDTLTGLPNRLHMWRHLDELLKKTSSLKNITVLILNIDRFRDVNDALGHVAGDQVLVTLANRFHDRIESDDLLSRTQGDQFVIISQCDKTRSRWLETSLQEAVQEPIEIAGHPISLSASIGISHYPEDGQNCDTLLSNAEVSMHAIKINSQGFTVHAPEGVPTTKDRLLISSALKRAISHNGLFLYYQPQVSTATKRVHGLEALARWHDDQLGHIPPSKFIALAEETGQIEALSRWVLREACKQLTKWREEGIQIPTTSVNMSAVNFQKADFPDYVGNLLYEFSLPGDSLIIEITESSTVALTQKMQETLGRIRDLGVGLSIDDFGTGYSSLTNLVQLPVTEVKIDRSFIEKILEDNRLRALVHSVIELGRSLGLVVVAEGVETMEQYSLLHKYHCQVIQGYFFSRPLSPNQVGKWLSTL